MNTVNLIVGYGRSGQAVASVLAREGVPFDVFDDRPFDSLDPILRQQFEGQQFFSDLSTLNSPHYRNIILSPGVPVNHPVVSWARHANPELISELEFAARRTRKPILAVTGSNGKSTTVTLIHDLLQDAGVACACVGNIGTPLSAHLDDSVQCFVVEVSSFQLEWVRDFKPKVGILLNISPDHMDRHGSLEVYLAAKLNLFKAQSPDDLALVPPGFRDQIPGRARILELPGAAFQLDESLLHTPHGAIDLSGFSLLGDHNRSNLMFAVAAVSEFGITPPQVEAALPILKGLEHRMEPVGTIHDRLWINDSKATNPAAAQQAIDAMTSPFILILGGSDKGADFREINLEHRPVRHIVAYGQTRHLIARAFPGGELTAVERFDEACQLAYRLSQPGDILLLSPACASFDQHENFAHRGRAFKRQYRLIRESQTS